MTKLEKIDLEGKRVLLRLDLNVTSRIPEEIQKEERTQNALPIIKYVTDKKGIAIPMSHLGRPGGKPNKKDSLEPVAQALSTELGKDVTLAPDCIGDKVEEMIDNAQPGDTILLQNLRFHKEEKDNAPKFVEALAKLGDIYIDDAFGTIHRDHASTYGLPLKFKEQNKPVAAGPLIQKEIKTWTEAMESEGPKYLCLGGKKLKEKISALEKLSEKFDKVYVGGPVYSVIRAAQGRSVGKSLIKEKNDDTDYVAKTKGLLQTLDNLVLPDKLVIARIGKGKEGGKEIKVYLDEKTIAETDEVPEGYMILDCIYESGKLEEFNNVDVAIAFGPLGVFEDPRFAKGTNTMAEAFNNAKKAILGGGESGQAYALAKKAYISTGGGAAVKFLIKKVEGKELNAVKVLK